MCVFDVVRSNGYFKLLVLLGFICFDDQIKFVEFVEIIVFILIEQFRFWKQQLMVLVNINVDLLGLL